MRHTPHQSNTQLQAPWLMHTTALSSKRTLLPFLLVSIALHLLCMQFSHSTLLRPKPLRSFEGLPLKLRLLPPVSSVAPSLEKTRQRRPEPHSESSSQRPKSVSAAPKQAVRAAQQEPTDGSSDIPPVSPVEPRTDESSVVSSPDKREILAAARREAASMAREMNQSSGRRADFHSKAQENIDRQFEAAHAAGGAWFRSARVEEITTASDGNARVYRIVTPFGAFCRTYPANGGPPMNTTCPR